MTMMPTSYDPSAIALDASNPSIASPAQTPGAMVQPTGLSTQDYDQKLQTMAAVEQNWGLPALPDQTKLDLATQPGSTHQDIASFLYGLGSDINQAVNPLAAQPAAAAGLQSPALQLPALDTNPSSPVNRARRTWESALDEAAPTIVDPGSVRALKQQAIALGLVPKGTPVDDSWGPTDNSLAYNVSQAMLLKRSQGDRPGAISTPTLKNYFNDLFDPKGVLAGVTNAVLHSFVPSGHDMHEAAHGWMNWLHHPFSGHDFLHALSSSVPVLTPIVTDALMFTGVGEVLKMGEIGLKSADAMEGLYRSWKAGEVLSKADTKAAEFIGQATQPGFVASRLMRSGSGVAQDVGGKMAAWRNLRGVVMAKKAAQVGFRVGAAENTGAYLGPHDSTLTQGVQAENQKIGSVPYLSAGLNVVSLPFAPPHVFRPGTFLNVARPVANTLKRLTAVSQNQQITGEVLRGLNLKSLDDLTEKVGGDQAVTGAFVTHAGYAAAIDAKARAEALKNFGDDEQIDKREGAWLTARNRHVSHLVQIQPGDMPTYLWVMDAKTKGAGGRLLKDLSSDDDAIRRAAVDQMNEDIRLHNQQRGQYGKDLLDGLQPGMVENHVREHFSNEDNFVNWVAANHEIRSFEGGEGLYDAPGQSVTVDEHGHVKGLEYNDIGAEPAFKTERQFYAGLPKDHPSVLIAKELASGVPRDDRWKGMLQWLARPLDPASGRLVAATPDKVFYQDHVEMHAMVRTLESRIAQLDDLAKNGRTQGKLIDYFQGLGVPIHEVNDQRFAQGLTRAFDTDMGNGTLTASTVNDKVRGQARLLQKLSQMGVFNPYNVAGEGGEKRFAELADAKDALEKAKAQLAYDPVWSDKFKIPTHWDLDKKMDMLNKMSHYSARRVEGLPNELTEALGRYEYQAVHGGPFYMPHDVMNLVSPFAEVTRTTMHKLSLGTFTHSTSNELIGQMQKVRLHSGLVDALHEHGLLDKSKIVDGMSGDADELARNLWDEIHQRVNTVTQIQAEAKKNGSLPARFMANVHSALVPQGLRDLTAAQIRSAVDKTFPGQATGAAYRAVRRAVADSYDVGWRYNGLASIEDKVRKMDLVDNLLLGRTSSGHYLRNSLIGAGFGAGSSLAAGDTNPTDVAHGALVGAAYPAASRLGQTVARKALTAFGDPGNWWRYTDLPNRLARARNGLRFSLSPFFDMRRYVKGTAIAQMVAEHEGVQLPIRMGFGRLVKDYGAGADQTAAKAWDEAHGLDPGVWEDTERYYSQRGILGYSPREYQASTYYRMLQQGVDPDRARLLTDKIFSYGTGRSGLEKSANFIFFPFSFEKKVMTNAYHVLHDDFSRLLMIHDGLKAYDVLNQRYDLSKALADHVPVLNDLEKLNVLEHGISPGELGGVNAPFLKLFLPIGLYLKDGASHRSAQNLATRIAPAYNDISRLLSDVEQEGNVVFGKSHMTTRAEEETGYSQWEAMKSKLDAQLKTDGYAGGLSEVYSNSELSDVKNSMESYKTYLEGKYPAWGKALAKAVGSQSALEQNLLVDLSTRDMGTYQQQAFHDFVDGGGDPTDQQAMLQALGPKPSAYAFLDVFNEAAKVMTSTLNSEGTPIKTNPESVAPSDYALVRQYAIQLYQTAELMGEGALFKSLYKQYYAKTWGPIERTI